MRKQNKGSIDAATAEVKKEGSLGSETPATMGVVSEQTGEVPVWIVNDNAELGVIVNGRAFFLYKGDNIEYFTHDDGTLLLFRRVGKREFGETCKPAAYYEKGWNQQQRYLEPCVYHPGLSFGPPNNPEYEWRPLAQSGQGSEVPTQKAPTDSRREMKPGNHDMNAKGEHCPEQPLSASCSAAPSRKQEVSERLAKLERENVRRIKHLNRLGSWAQQDPTGPMSFDSHKIKEWVLSELKAALGSAYEPTEWQPDYIKLQDKVKKLEAAAARVEPTKKWEVYCECYVKFGKDAKDYVYVVDPVIAKQLVAAHNASCAVKEEEKDLGLR